MRRAGSACAYARSKDNIRNQHHTYVCTRVHSSSVRSRTSLICVGRWRLCSTRIRFAHTHTPSNPHPHTHVHTHAQTHTHTHRHNMRITMRIFHNIFNVIRRRVCIIVCSYMCSTVSRHYTICVRYMCMFLLHDQVHINTDGRTFEDQIGNKKIEKFDCAYLKYYLNNANNDKTLINSNITNVRTNKKQIIGLIYWICINKL